MAERAGKDFSGMWQLGHELPKRPRSAEGAAPQWVGDDKLAGFHSYQLVSLTATAFIRSLKL